MKLNTITQILLNKILFHCNMYVHLMIGVLYGCEVDNHSMYEISFHCNKNVCLMIERLYGCDSDEPFPDVDALNKVLFHCNKYLHEMI